LSKEKKIDQILLIAVIIYPANSQVVGIGLQKIRVPVTTPL
jgi:hypothetical protein